MRRQPHPVRYPRVAFARWRILKEPGHGADSTRAQAGWLEQAEEGAGRGALLLASATFLFLRKLTKRIHTRAERTARATPLTNSLLFFSNEQLLTPRPLLAARAARCSRRGGALARRSSLSMSMSMHRSLPFFTALFSLPSSPRPYNKSDSLPSPSSSRGSLSSSHLSTSCCSPSLSLPLSLHDA